MKIVHLLFGIATWIPGVYNHFSKGTGGTSSARYCYSVWLRHLVLINKHIDLGNGDVFRPKIIAELGPGDSLGIGLAALISGAKSYQAFDVVEYANQDKNLEIFDELVEMFKCRSPIPGDDEFPRIRPKLDNYQFPHDILDNNLINASLRDDRLHKLRNELISIGGNNNNKSIFYTVPWDDKHLINTNSIDLIISQAVLEYVDNLEGVYSSLRKWLRPGGVSSFVINHSAHHIDSKWNAHYCYSNILWKTLRGAHPYWLNRSTHSQHYSIILRTGFNVTYFEKVFKKSVIDRKKLSKDFINISNEDLTTSGSFFILKK